MEGCNHSNHKFLCGGCAQVSYCSEECALSHWDDGHKFECVDGGVKRDAPDEDEFKDTVQKMLKAAEEAELLEDVPLDDEDRRYENLNIEEIGAKEFMQLVKGATNMYRKGKLSDAVRQYVGDPAVTLKPNILWTLFETVMAIKQSETISEKRFMNYSEMQRFFGISNDRAKKTLGLAQFNQGRGTIAKIPIKAIFIQNLKVRWANAQHLVATLNAAIMQDVRPYREQKVFTLLQNAGMIDPKAFLQRIGYWGAFKTVKRLISYLTYYLSDIDDKTLSDMISHSILPLIALKNPELFWEDFAKGIVDEALKRRFDAFSKVYRSWLNASAHKLLESSAFLVNMTGGPTFKRMDPKYGDPQNMFSKSIRDEILSIIYERLKTKHPEWLV